MPEQNKTQEKKVKAKKSWLKKLAIFFAWLFVIVLAIVLALPLWIGPVVKSIANSVVPEKTGTSFSLGEFAFNPYAGTMHVGKVELGNPSEFAKGNCVELRDLDVNLEIGSVMSDKIHIREIVLDGLFIAIEKNGDNFKKIAKNASAEPTKPTADDTKLAKTETQVEPKEKLAKKDEACEKRVVIDRVLLKNTIVKYGLLPIPVPTLEIKDIGANKAEGASYVDVVLAVYEALLKSVGAVGDLGKGLLDSGSAAATTTIGATADATQTTLKSVESTVNSIKDLKNMFKKEKKNKKNK